ncbi:Scr1 family TA system antitoxin-like transcriptional regulator [Pilimelia anulata]|uniref:Scr1 family TA system antitoxin-like transcriptional regulator n=1 Tax=Pilimelia anulata TaxID=53371 RepID=UPI00227D78DD|nr:Scr1 family TA system antitoxin-like transcriptional regulator [Pilimelia anulata]
MARPPRRTGRPDRGSRRAAAARRAHPRYRQAGRRRGRRERAAVRYCDDAAHEAQLAHLLVIMRRPNVSVGILPLAARVGAVAPTGFWIFDDTSVTVELATAR